MGKQAITEQDGNLIPPICRQRGTAATDPCFIHDIVMNQGGQVNHLDDDRHHHMRIPHLARGSSAQRDQSGAQLFALICQRILGIDRNIPLELVDLVAQALNDSFEKRLSRGDDALPRQIDIQSGRYWNGCFIGAGLGYQHAGQNYVPHRTKSNRYTGSALADIWQFPGCKSGRAKVEAFHSL